MGAGLAQGHGGPIVGKFPVGAPLPKSPYEGGKQRRHFTLSNQAYGHLGLIAQEAGLSAQKPLSASFAASTFQKGGLSFLMVPGLRSLISPIVHHETL
jgi:hypothetical protein